MGNMRNSTVTCLQGVGYATMTIVFWLDIYYCIIIAWTLYYLIATLSSVPELPWRHCGQSQSRLNLSVSEEIFKELSEKDESMWNIYNVNT